MFNSLLSKLAVVAVTAVVGLGAVTAPAHALGKTLSGELGNGMTYSGSFEGEDTSGGGAIEFDPYGWRSVDGKKKNELTAFTMTIFYEGKVFESLGLDGLNEFYYSEKGALNGDTAIFQSNFFNGFFFNGTSSSSYVAMGIYDSGMGTEIYESNNLASFKMPDGDYAIDFITKSEINDLQSVPEPASMLGLLAVGATGISTLKRKKKASTINIPSPELTGV